MTRREQREALVALLYEYTYRDGMDAHQFISEKEAFDEAECDAYVKDTFIKCVASVSELDEAIKKYAVRWKISRISKITKSVLRLGVYELTFTETPPKVIINEAVELAKIYGEDKASGFVNGILNNFARGEGKLGEMPSEEKNASDEE